MSSYNEDRGYVTPPTPKGPKPRQVHGYEPLNPAHPSFDPRVAALNHAALIEDDTQRNHATAIACALIYVGDQLGNVCSHLEQLDVTVHNQLHEIAEAM